MNSYKNVLKAAKEFKTIAAHITAIGKIRAKTEDEVLFDKSRTDSERLAKMKDSEIDFSDIPEVTPAQFAKAVVRKGLKPVPKKISNHFEA